MQKLPTIPSKRACPHVVISWKAFNAALTRRYPTRLGNLCRHHVPLTMSFFEVSSAVVGHTILIVRIIPSIAVISPTYSRLAIPDRLNATPSAGRNDWLPAVSTSWKVNSSSLHDMAWALTRSCCFATWDNRTACLISSRDSSVVREIQWRKYGRAFGWDVKPSSGTSPRGKQEKLYNLFHYVALGLVHVAYIDRYGIVRIGVQ